MPKPRKPRRRRRRAKKKEKPKRKYRRKPRKPKPKKKGQTAYIENAKLYPRAGRRAQLQLLRTQNRSNETLKKQRYGFKLMWQELPRVMRRYEIGELGSFDFHNGHNGVCWGWPKECELTNTQARAIYQDLYKKRTLTLHQMIVVRKALSFAFELTGGVPGGNFVGVKEVWGIIKKSTLADQMNHVKPLPHRIPTPKHLKRAFTSEWTPQSPMSLVEHSQGLVAGHDWAIFGLRSTEDIKRVKKSVPHHYDWEEGWLSTTFVGGRAKLCGVKKGTRDWSIWTTCFCPGKHHVRPPLTFFVEIGADGNPNCAVKWCTVCPLACLEFLWQLQTPQGPKRRYAKWCDSGRFGTSNINDVAACAIDWFIKKGVITAEQRFSRNAGRKSLAAWTAKLLIPYEESVQIHQETCTNSRPLMILLCRNSYHFP